MRFAVVVVCVSSVAFAGSTTANLGVSATVQPGCSISTSPVAFGVYAPLSTHASSPATANGTVSVTCTLGTAAVVTLGQGGSAGSGSTDAAPVRRLTDGSNFLSYALFRDMAMLLPWGNTTLTGIAHVGLGTQVGITVYGKLDAGQVVPAGSYTDTVVATVSF
ncbi:MAG: spore coat U domain-containing protein [Archangium sp.]